MVNTGCSPFAEATPCNLPALCVLAPLCVRVRSCTCAYGYACVQAERRQDSAALLAALAEAGVLDVLPLPGGNVAGAWSGLEVGAVLTSGQDSAKHAAQGLLVRQTEDLVRELRLGATCLSTVCLPMNAAFRSHIILQGVGDCERRRLSGELIVLLAMQHQLCSPTWQSRQGPQ